MKLLRTKNGKIIDSTSNNRICSLACIRGEKILGRICA